MDPAELDLPVRTALIMIIMSVTGDTVCFFILGFVPIVGNVLGFLKTYEQCHCRPPYDRDGLWLSCHFDVTFVPFPDLWSRWI